MFETILETSALIEESINRRGAGSDSSGGLFLELWHCALDVGPNLA